MPALSAPGLLRREAAARNDGVSGFTWLSIVRLGLIQAALGSVVVLVTSTLNRVMIVELALPAIVPGMLVALHYVVQVLRPRMGYGSDVGGRRTPFVVGGMALMSAGAVGAAAAVGLMATQLWLGLVLAFVAFLAVGVGVGSAGTALLTLVASSVVARRRGPAATIMWLMMILGIAVTAIVAGKMLEPFSTGRLFLVVAAVALGAFLVSGLAIWGVEGRPGRDPHPNPLPEGEGAAGFLVALAGVWREGRVRRFAVFVFVSMLAYSSQELVIEPFAGAVFGLTPGQSTGLTGLHHGGVLLGMAAVAVLSFGFGGLNMRAWTVGGCLGSAVAILAVAGCGLMGPAWSLRPAVFVLGAANGAFAIAAIGSMMGLASEGREGRAGTRVGLWGAAQALAFGAGGLFGTGLSDVARAVLGDPALAYGAVFVCEAALFVAAAGLALRVFERRGEPAYV